MKKFWVIIITACILLNAFLASDVFAGPPLDVGGRPDFYFDIIVQGLATDLLNGTWRYDYTLSPGSPPDGATNPQLVDMSHWWIELPEEKISTLSGFNPSGVDGRGNPNPEVGWWNEPSGEPDGFQGFHWGVKWDSYGITNDGFVTYSFISTHAPVYTEGGQIDEEAYNWFAKSGGSFYDFGLTLGPNGEHGEIPDNPSVPEPATMMLFGTGLIGAFLRRKQLL